MAACLPRNVSLACWPNVCRKIIMQKADALPMQPDLRGGMRPAVLIVILFAAAAALAWRQWTALLPISAWGAALQAPDVNDARQMLMHYTVLPRMVVALLSGAALGLAGTVCQQVLRNPLAEPTTLGVSAAAQLA